MNKYKILIGFIFIIAGVLVGAVFVNATNYSQLAIAAVLYSLLALFFFIVFPRGTQVSHSGRLNVSVWPPAGLSEVGTATGGNADAIDIDKRTFLKLIGGAGLAFFLFSVFRNKIEGLFFKGLPSGTSSQGTIANSESLAQNQPMDGYSISEIDDNIIAFYGFTNNDGNWFIMREDTDTGSFRYTKGVSNFPSNWDNRANLKYSYYSSVFKSN